MFLKSIFWHWGSGRLVHKNTEETNDETWIMVMKKAGKNGRNHWAKKSLFTGFLWSLEISMGSSQLLGANSLQVKYIDKQQEGSTA